MSQRTNFILADMQNLKYLIVIFTSLLLTNFLGATYFSNTILLLLLLPFLFSGLKTNSLFKNYILALVFFVIINIFSCYYFNGQSITSSLKATSPYLHIIFYFLLLRINLPIEQMEKAIIVLTIIFCICYIIQYIIYPITIFSGASIEFQLDVRIRLAGQGISSLGYFLGLNKYLKTKRISYLILSLLCFVIIFLMGFRTMIAMVVLFSLVIVIRINGFNWKFVWYSILACIFILLILQFPIFDEKVTSMLERQQTQNFGNPNYIRVIEFLHFTGQHFKNIWEYIFGSGLPFYGESESLSNYSKYMFSLEDKRLIYWVDWGLIGLSWVLGLPAVLAMFAYSIKVIRLKILYDYFYLKLWYIYLLTLSITTMEFYRPGNFIIQALVLYLIERVYKLANPIEKFKITNEKMNSL